MALAHAQLFSLHQLRQLTERAKYHANLSAKQSAQEPDIEALFSDDDDDDLSFYF